MIYLWIENKHDQYLKYTISDSSNPSDVTAYDLFSFKDGTINVQYINYEHIALPLEEAFCFETINELDFLISNCTALCTHKFLSEGRTTLLEWFRHLNIKDPVNTEVSRFLVIVIASFINTDANWIEFIERRSMYRSSGMAKRFVKYLTRFTDKSYYDVKIPVFFPMTIQHHKERLEREQELKKQSKLFLITKNIDGVVTEYVATVIGTSIEDVKERYKMRSNIYVTLIDNVDGIPVSLTEK